MTEKMNALLEDIYRTFGLKTKILTPVIGWYAFAKLKREEKRLSEGWTYEPSAFITKNAAALSMKHKRAARVRIAIPEAPRPIPEPASVHGT
jgi:hypothetical protein